MKLQPYDYEFAETLLLLFIVLALGPGGLIPIRVALVLIFAVRLLRHYA